MVKMLAKFNLFLLGFFLAFTPVQAQEEIKEIKQPIQISEVERLRIEKKLLEMKIASMEVSTLINNLLTDRKLNNEDYYFDINNFTINPKIKN